MNRTGFDELARQEDIAAHAARSGQGISSKDSVKRRFLRVLADSPVPLSTKCLAAVLTGGREDICEEVLNQLQDICLVRTLALESLASLEMVWQITGDAPEKLYEDAGFFDHGDE
jgi:hypothetical protein